MRFTLLDAYPLPNIDEQISAIAKGTIFSTLDLKSAFYQIPLCPEDSQFTAFEADGKLYQYTRIPFGVTNGVSFFQRVVNELIAKYELHGTYAYLDNITVSGVNKSDHDAKLKTLIKAAEAEKLTFNFDKCVFAKSEVDLLGYQVSHLKIQPDPERLRPLRKLPVPSTKKELLRALGMFSYYARWISDFSNKIRPLTKASKLLIFSLPNEAIMAFNSLKCELESACLLCVKEGNPFTIECNASEHTNAATLNQGGQPVTFHSRILAPTELRYPIVEKEAAAIIDAVRKWSHYLHGQKFLLITDQRAVAYMFIPQRTGKIKNMKLQIWRSELENFNYKIIRKLGKDNVVPDTFSRVCSITYNGLDLSKMHQQLGHPGVTRLVHFVRTKNLPFSVDDVKRVCSTCKICADLKPKFFRKLPETLKKFMRP